MPELIRRTLAEKFADLPEMCAAVLPGYNTTIIIKRGESGYYPANAIDPHGFNARRNITEAQVMAMRHGSMFGWDTAGADPLNFTKTTYEEAARREGWTISRNGKEFVDSDGNYFDAVAQPNVSPNDPNGWENLCKAEGIEITE